MGRRTLGWGLILYGIVGLVLIATGAVLGLQAAGRIERLVQTADGTLAAAARATDAAAESFVSVDGSLAEAQASSEGAAALARNTSATLGSLATAMELSFFGTQPLLPLASEFSTSAEQATQLADTLDTMGGSLGDTRTDAGRIGTELGELSRELRSLQESTSTQGDGPPLRLFVTLLLAWLAVPALGGLIGGGAVLRTRPVPVPPV